MPKLNAAGNAAYGFGTIAIDGAVPAALAALVANGANWLSTSLIVFQDYTVDPAVLKTYNTGSAAIATVSASGANTLRAGGNVWMKWLGGVGVDSNIGGWTILPAAALGDVSETGITAVCTDRANGVGVTIYSAAGAVTATLATGLLTAPSQVVPFGISCRYGLVTYQNASGWNMVRATTGAAVSTFVSRANILMCIPVVVGTQTWVFEYNTETSRMELRNIATGQGFIVSTAATLGGDEVFFFGADARAFSGKIRLAGCTVQGEDVGTLVTIDVDLTTGATTRGTVSGGAMVYAAGPTFEAEAFPGSAASMLYLPYSHPVVEPEKKNTAQITDPWYAVFEQIRDLLQAYGTTLNNLPTTPPAGFGVITSPSQPAAAAVGPNDVLQLEGDGVTITIDGANRKVTLTVAAADPDLTYLTVDNETADLPNSRRLMAGTDVTFDDTVPGERTINVAAEGSGLVGAFLTMGG